MMLAEKPRIYTPFSMFQCVPNVTKNITLAILVLMKKVMKYIAGGVGKVLGNYYNVTFASNVFAPVASSEILTFLETRMWLDWTMDGNKYHVEMFFIYCGVFTASGNAFFATPILFLQLPKIEVASSSMIH